MFKHTSSFSAVLLAWCLVSCSSKSSDPVGYSPNTSTGAATTGIKDGGLRAEQLSPDAIIRELRSRSSQKDPFSALSSTSAPIEIHSALKSLTGDQLCALYENRIKSIYGDDDRIDLFNLSAANAEQDRVLQTAGSVVAMVLETDIRDNNDRSDPADPFSGTSSLSYHTFKSRYGLCDSERFKEQPSVSCCSGALIGEDLVLTAGHCVGNDKFPPSSVRFVFGYRMRDETNAVLKVANAEIYEVKEIVGRSETSSTDWAIVRLVRSVKNHQPLPVAQFDPSAPNSPTGKIGDNTPVFTIGYPCGLPAKYCPNAKVRDNSASAYFIADLDTYGGNSGSPVFANMHGRHEIVGVLVRGLDDFDFAPCQG